MTTAVYPVLVPNYHFHERPAFINCEQPKQDLHHTPPKEFLNVTHSTLWVNKQLGSPQPTSEEISVTVYDGSTGTKVPLDMKSTDTIGKLKQSYVKKKPHMSGSLDLVFNGKPAHSNKTLCELGVKPGATLLTYQKCIGG